MYGSSVLGPLREILEALNNNTLLGLSVLVNLHWSHLNSLGHRGHSSVAPTASVVDELLVDEQPDDDEDGHEDEGDQGVGIVKLHEVHVETSLLRTSIVNFDGNLRLWLDRSFTGQSGWHTE